MQNKITFLKSEAAIFKLDISIRSALNVSDPQISECCQLLTELFDMEIEPLMLKKQPEIVNTIRLDTLVALLRGF